MLLTILPQYREENSANDEQNAGDKQVREVLENVFPVVEFDDANHGCCHDDREEHREVWPKADGAVKLRVDPWQEKEISKAQPSGEERKSGWNEGLVEFSAMENVKHLKHAPIVSGNFLYIFNSKYHRSRLRPGRKVNLN